MDGSVEAAISPIPAWIIREATPLYEKFGFQLEGRRRQAIYQNGQHRDDLIMGLLL